MELDSRRRRTRRRILPNLLRRDVCPATLDELFRKDPPAFGGDGYGARARRPGCSPTPVVWRSVAHRRGSDVLAAVARPPPRRRTRPRRQRPPALSHRKRRKSQKRREGNTRRRPSISSSDTSRPCFGAWRRSLSIWTARRNLRRRRTRPGASTPDPSRPQGRRRCLAPSPRLRRPRRRIRARRVAHRDDPSDALAHIQRAWPGRRVRTPQPTMVPTPVPPLPSPIPSPKII